MNPRMRLVMRITMGGLEKVRQVRRVGPKSGSVRSGDDDDVRTASRTHDGDADGVWRDDGDARWRVGADNVRDGARERIEGCVRELRGVRV